ncbi:hypothetical protein SSX86_003618 [Deinandra increscens subsp. villosa]|uniref:DUF3741 domain-containing protein n=1 Tax=Deinandra increscens subsp. villosa TaxID=3103831 RepID=A0AAP0DHK9_9ASTR
MGREWLYLYKPSGGGGRKTTPAAAATKPTNKKKVKDRNTPSSGCMSVIFKLFDIQNHQFRFHHPSFLSESTITTHQAESPESAMNVGAPSSLKDKDQPNLNIPMGRIQIKTKRSRFPDDISSECSSSPGTKTPNLVARLMGLDLLPEYSSPRPSSSSTPATSHHPSRSLPATPRTSTAGRRSTDTDYHHRLSLQIDKENGNLQTKMQRRRSELPTNRQDDDSKTQYAKQITNQVRERISRRLGTDITNIVSKDRRRDSDLVLLKPVKSPAVEIAGKLKRDDTTPLSKVRLLDIKSNLEKSKYEIPKSHPKSPVKDEKIRRIASERYDLRLKKKSTALRNRAKNTTKILSFKKEMTSSSSKARSSKLQVFCRTPPDSCVIYGSDWTGKLSERIGGFRAAHCEVLEDIGRSNRKKLLATAFEAEGEEMVKEIESEIMEGLVYEIATETVAPARSDRVRSHVLFT